MRVILVQAQLRHDGSTNLDRIRGLLDVARIDFARGDVLLLPERFDPRVEAAPYERDVTALARSLGCHVVGGSHHERRAGGSVNAGVVVDPTGGIIGRYEKLRPYASERQFIEPGTGLGEFTIQGTHVLVLICADFWFVDLVLRATRAPDVVLVPALSVTRKSSPDYSRALWRHLAISRAYEFGAYVGVSDWAYPSELPFTSPQVPEALRIPPPSTPRSSLRPSPRPASRSTSSTSRPSMSSARTGSPAGSSGSDHEPEPPRTLHPSA